MKTSPLKTVILTAPQGWGKTRNAEALRLEFGCTRVIDDWAYGTKPTPGALHLTNRHPSQFRNNKPELATLVSRGWDGIAA